MGRYYTTATGREGKFGVACQSSTDPADYFGMAESRITYVAGEGDAKHIKQKLNEIYDKARVPEQERTYQLSDEYKQFYDSYHKYFFETCEKGHFAGENGTTERETFPNAHLAMSRLWLGLVVLTDINEDGYCELEAEL